MNSCEICEKFFSSNQTKEQHKRIVHGEVKIFECSVCSKKFGYKIELTIHVKIHMENNLNIIDHNCKFCGKFFVRSGSLSQHIKNIHLGKRNNKCDFCGKSFTLSGDLKKHIMTIHEGQRNYKCDYCEKSFSQSGPLKYHINRVHEGQKV